MNENNYWDIISLKLKNVFYPRTIYEHYWITHNTLIQKWFKLDQKKNIRILKTDMFEESKSKDFFSYYYVKKHNVTGIDISENVLSNVLETKNLSLLKMDLRDLKFKENSFDLIISLSTLDHLDADDFQKAIVQMSKALKNNGEVFLTLDNRHNKLFYLEFFFWKYIVNIYDRDRCYEIDDVEKIISKTNFKIVDVDSAMFFPPFADKILILLNLISPKLKPFTNKASELILKIVGKSTKTKTRRILFGRFLAFRLKKKQ